jgi:hypothetical protein
MSDKPADGGPAFPAMHFDLAEGEHGLSIRDYFAAKAMQGMISAGRDILTLKFATASYQIADVMLAARKS